MAAEEKSLSPLSNTKFPKPRKKPKKTLDLDDIKYLNIHSEKIAAENGDKQQIKKASNTENNDKREQLIEFIFSMNSDHPFLSDGRWLHWYTQAQIIKPQLQQLFKGETGDTVDGDFDIKQMGGSKYSYDFAVNITSKNDKSKKTFIPLEYKHQSSLGKLPQFYQVGNVSKPFFETPYHDYYYQHGLPEINELIGIDIKLRGEDKDTYAKLIGKSVYSKKDWDKIRDGTFTTCSPISEQLKSLRKTYERGQEGSPTYKKQQQIVKKTITKYLTEMKDTDMITDELIDAIQKQITDKQKPIDHNGNHKDKIYLLCGYESNDLIWKLAQYPSGDFILQRDPTKVIVEQDKLIFPTEGEQNLEIRLRWQNVSGLCNPSWQMKLTSNTTKRTPNRSNTTKRTPNRSNTTKRTPKRTPNRSNTTTKKKRTTKTASTTRKRTRSPSKSPTRSNTRVNKKRRYSPIKSPEEDPMET